MVSWCAAFVMVLCSPTVSYSGNSYSELIAVLTHCDQQLPVASYPVLWTHTCPGSLGEFTVNSRRGHHVLLCFPPLPHCISRLHTHTQCLYVSRPKKGTDLSGC
ncbi:hypothetical protein XENOCAPTIV_021658 [Xenoophorus captivus]|uniref:Secreted protein n=1 Tax=Xenoophorus captivus TaxID=1517983 RepID=A0ABV0SBX1_9TELE